ncbi:MAG: lamin tail domain-containing protein [Ilumatobacteraceae bacterium]|nr:lamin tail domain-containing protein [Ilumatobacteraceae bacterium]
MPVWGWVAGLVALIVGIAALPDTNPDDATISIGDTPPVTQPFVDVPAATSTGDTLPTQTTTAQDTAPSELPATTPAQATTPETSTAPGLSPAITEAAADLASLRTADPDPDRPPYERTDYDGGGWADFDGDCVSTRHELLIAASLDEPVMSDGCYVESGRWIDPYTGDEHSESSQVTIDHVVPLAEAHRSGAWKWDLDSKRRFANDETPGHLVVVGADVNQSKADSTPDQWLPPAPSAHCQYTIDWITSKSRYDLTVTAVERAALGQALDTCSAKSVVRPVSEAPAPIVVITVPTTTTTTTIAPAPGPGVVTLLACDKRAEVVTIGNTGGQTASLSGFLLHDEGLKHSTSLGDYGTLEPGQQLRLLSGPDASPGTGEVVWTGQNVWNNDGDVATLIAPDGTQQIKNC